MSLDHVYSAWWFVVLSAFFALNTLLCAVHRIKLSPKSY
ncbi:cytochrome c biogenesis protein ResB [Thermanaeromonas sp.]